MRHLDVRAPDGLPEVTVGTDLAALVAGAVALRDGDVVVVTSKVVSKAEGRVRPAADDAAHRAALDEETVRVVARRGPVRIVLNRLGLVMAAAGIDRSNVEPGHLVLLPEDPDSSARALRSRLLETAGVNVGVVVTDTAGRAWREGQTDIAIGVAGLVPAERLAGRRDSYGNLLEVTLPAVADELAGAAELAQGKLGGRPVAVVRGRSDLVLPPGTDGPGAVALQRAEGADLFGYGAREAVLVALAGDPAGRAAFGAAVSPAELLEALSRALVAPVEEVGGQAVATPAPPGARRLAVRVPRDAAPRVLAAVCFSHGWRLDDVDGAVAHVSPASP